MRRIRIEISQSRRIRTRFLRSRRIRIWRMRIYIPALNLGSAPTTYFECRVGSELRKEKKLIVGSGRVWSVIWSVGVFPVNSGKNNDKNC